jgi:hypothetical protein
MHNTSTKCVMNRSWIWPKLSIIVIVRSMLGILRAVVNILSTWIYERGLGTLPGYNTHSLHDTMALSYHDGQEVWFDKVGLCLCVWLLRLVLWYETPKCNNLRWGNDKCACAVVWYKLHLYENNTTAIICFYCCYRQSGRTSLWQSYCQVFPRPFKLDVRSDYWYRSIWLF